MTKTELPKAINLRDVDVETGKAILDIQTSFHESAASKAVVRAITRYMPLYREHQETQRKIRQKDDEIRELHKKHSSDLRLKDIEIERLKVTIQKYLKLKDDEAQLADELKKMLV